MSNTALKVGAGVGVGVAALAGTAAGLRRSRGPAPIDPNDPGDYELPPGTDHRVTTDDGAELAVTDAGTGAPVVLVHCWMGARAVWAPVANRLVRDGHRVVMYDQRGHGDSSAGSGGFSISRLASDLATVLEARDVRDAVLAGHSMGGMTVMGLLTDHVDVAAERGKAMVLVSTAAAGLVAAGRPGAAQVIASPLTDRVVASRFGHIFQRGTVGVTACREHLVAWRDLMVATPAASRVGCMRAMAEMDLREALGRADWPVTVLVGSHDRLTPRRHAAEIASLVPGAQLEVLDGMGHMLPFEAADRVAETIAKAAVGDPAGRATAASGQSYGRTS